jgi:hypothetical protein
MDAKEKLGPVNINEEIVKQCVKKTMKDLGRATVTYALPTPVPSR